jgi:hypothetical protein
MTLRKHSPAHDFWHPRVESQIRETMRVHARWFVFRDDGDRHRCIVSAQLTAHSKLRRDGTGMVSTIEEVDTIDERCLKPFETRGRRRVAERPATL